MLFRHRPDRRSSSRGVGLMEAVVTIGIMTMVLVMVADVFAVNNNLVALSLGRADNDNGAVLALKRLGELARGAGGVVSSQTINGTAYVSSSTVLVLKLPTIDPSNNIISGSYDYIAFYRDSTDATKIYTDLAPAAGSVRVSGKKLLTAYNQTLAFSYNNAAISQATRVSVFIVNQQTVRLKMLTTRAWTSIFLRNF